MENDILRLLQGSPGTRFSFKEIGRIVDRRQYREDRNWARPVLERLAYEGNISKEDTLYFFLEEEVGSVSEVKPCSRSGAVGPLETHELKVDENATLEVVTEVEL